MKQAKFEGIDLIETMGRIADIHMTAYKNDFNLDRQTLRKAAEKAPETFVWMCRRKGTWLLEERSIFLKDTREHNTFRFYLEQRMKDVLVFNVEVTGITKDIVFGNLYSLDYPSQYRRVLAASQEGHAVMHYEKEDRVIPIRNITFQYDKEYGQLLNWDYLAESEDNLLMLLREEKKIRARFSVGNVTNYLTKLR